MDNNNTFKLTDALGGIDDALVSEAARASRPKKSRTAWIAAAAAALVLIAGLAVALPKLIKPAKPDVTALAPTEEADINSPEATEEPSDEPAYYEHTETPEPEEPVVTAEPAPDYSTMQFDSFDSLNHAVCTVGTAYSDAAVYGLDAVYMPTKVPYGAKLSDITVTSDAVILTYGISEEWIIDESDPNRFVVVWHRDWAPGSAEAHANDRGGVSVSSLDGVYIVREMSNIEIAGVWEYDGCVFELVAPGAYCEDSDVAGLTGLKKVALGDINAHFPAEGFEIEGWMWLSENDMGFNPLMAPAYTTAYSGSPEGGMIRTEGRAFLDCLPADRSYENLLNSLARVGCISEPVLLADTDIVSIDVYHTRTLELLAHDISLEELNDIAWLHVDPALAERIKTECADAVLVDIVIEHRLNYIPELDDYEVEAYHCGYILFCGC